MNPVEKQFLRDVIGKHMLKLGESDERVAVVNADLMGTCRNRAFCEKYPERAFNVGIAEQNLVSFSAGLAHEGFIVYAFSMAPFLSMRACEQVRTDVAYGNLNVRLMATYSGCSGGISGATHWSIEDCSIMSGIPNITIIEPSDAVSAVKLLENTLSYDGPIYFRSSIEPVSKIYDEKEKFEIGKSKIIHEGNDGAFICSGSITQNALNAAESIKKKYNKSIKVVDVLTIKPIDKSAIIEAIKTSNVIVAQDHNVFGGLGSMVAKLILEEGCKTDKFKILGINDSFDIMAHTDFLHHKHHIDAEGLELEMMRLIGGEQE